MTNTAAYNEITDGNQTLWDSVVRHPLQSWAWGDFRTSVGIPVSRLGLFEKNRLTSGVQLTFHAVPFSPFTVGYAPKGPMPSIPMLEALRTLGKKHNAIFIQLEPDIIEEESSSLPVCPFFIPSHHPLFTKYTFVMNLSGSEEDLLKSFHQKTRYNIRLAQKRGVVVKEDNSNEAFRAYMELQKQTTKRQKFYAHNERYHTALWNTLKANGMVRLFTAVYKKTVLCAFMVFVWEKTVYYPYGASSREHRDVMAPNLMLWEIARWAKSKGLYYFDLWGALGPQPDMNDPWYGFHRFKEGYNPTLVEYAGSFDLLINPVAYRLYTIADTIRWMYLKHKPF